MKYKLTEKEKLNIYKNHPAVSTDSCKNCGGYQTVLREFDKWYMTMTTTCKQCGKIEVDDLNT